MMNKTSKKPLVAVTLAICALLAACASTPTEPDQSTQTASTKALPDQLTTVQLAQTDIRCVRQRKTGTHMFTKVCTTAEQRRKIAEETKALVGRTRGSHDLSVSNGGPKTLPRNVIE